MLDCLVGDYEVETVMVILEVTIVSLIMFARVPRRVLHRQFFCPIQELYICRVRVQHDAPSYVIT